MKALKYNGTWDISIQEVEDLHVVESNDVVVEIKYCGICGTDIGIVSGSYPIAVKGVTIGHEASGIVKKIGSEVSNVKVGDRVSINPTYHCGKCRMCKTHRINHCEQKFGTESGVSYDGAFADFFRTKSEYVYKIPDDISLKEVTLIEPLSCVISGVRKINITATNIYAYVFGAGPMGILYTWALTLKGVIPVVIEKSDARYEYAKICLPQSVNIFKSLEEARASFTDIENAPIDLVVDTTSVLLEEIYPHMACGGTYMSIGLKEKYMKLNVMELADKSLSVVGSIDSLDGSFQEAFDIITKKLIPADKIISHVFPLSDYKKAFATIGCDIDLKKMILPKDPNAKILIEC